MMKTKKWFAGGIAVVLAAVSAMTCTAGAADFQKGDVDKDGIVSPVDAKMVLQECVEIELGNASTLTDEQKALADWNGDGVITQEDAIGILEAAGSPYDLNQDGTVTQADFELAASALQFFQQQNPNQSTFTLEDYDAACGLTELQFKIVSMWNPTSNQFSTKGIQLALSDALDIPVGDIDFDGTVSLEDATAILKEFCELGVHNPSTMTALQAVVADVDYDGTIELSDACDALTIYSENAVTPQA